jgi:Protein of unknown function (DUF2752)
MSTPRLASAPAVRWEAPRGAMPLGAVFGGITALACGAVGLLGLDHIGITPCFFRLATGLPCPTCGSTRAFGRLFHLDLPGALLMNPLAAVSALVLLLWGALDLTLLPGRRALRASLAPPFHNKARFLIVALVLVNWAFLLFARR